MSRNLTVHGYAHNGIVGMKPRVPMVHLLASGDADVSSITFHPDDAEAVAEAILRAARAAKAGRKFKGTTIDFRPHG
jgi:hypothetical protein